MTEYAILLPGDESVWAQASAEERAEMYGRHMKFAELLAQRGHKITAGNELTASTGARVVRGGLDQVTVTEGPYAETAEQLTGFYVVDTDDLEDLCKVVGILAEGSNGVEVRECVDHSG
ncbi:MAG: transcription initiation protein [Nocardioidaceae bacterium]|nr:transcription initiation protein [Nocardioidaceae bacterium]